MDEELRAYLDRRFDGIENRLTSHDQRFGDIDKRFGEIDRRFGEIDKRFGEIDKRFGEIDKRFDQVFERIDAVQAGMFRRVDEMAATLEEQFREQQTEVLKAAFTMQEHVGMRLREQDNGLSALRDRCAILERRLFEIEKRLLMPPQ
jgi:chromosome segregation ATPase